MNLITLIHILPIKIPLTRNIVVIIMILTRSKNLFYFLVSAVKPFIGESLMAYIYIYIYTKSIYMINLTGVSSFQDNSNNKNFFPAIKSH